MTLCEEYQALLTNLSPQAPLALDPLIFDPTDRAEPAANGDPGFPASYKLWSLLEERHSCIGIRLREQLANPHVVAARLAAMAVERQIIPIFLTYISTSEFQRFGFRIEHVAGCNDIQREASEEQIWRFWNLAMVIEAKDIEKLG
ncbi:hypothetical protein [uncultured Roseobacter sp.]|uniref:hypothetical protein n=1 Tax=uncultured Roseobacter sp. TaxID=114847 RepID=UPI00260AC67F|nr:hypothetical protein [uncultured Roseobacter sp.]